SSFSQAFMKSKGFCCQNEKVKLALLEPSPPAISQLLTGSDIITGERYVQDIRNILPTRFIMNVF
ncbi:23786_t:CDS:1, partial [Racocetra persica]